MPRKTTIGGDQTETESYIGQLIKKLPIFDSSWPDEIKLKWFNAFFELLRMADLESSSSNAGGQNG